MPTNKKLDPALAETVERVLEDLMTRFEAAEEQLESRADLPEISAETETNLLREIEADLDLYYPRAKLQAATRATPIVETVGQMITWLRVSGSDMLDRIAELVLPVMPTVSVARSRSRILENLEAIDGVDEKTLRELVFVPIRLEREEQGTNRLVLRYFGTGLTPDTPPEILLRLDGEPQVVEIESNLPNSPPEVEIIWVGRPVRLNRIGWSEQSVLVVDLSISE